MRVTERLEREGLLRPGARARLVEAGLWSAPPQGLLPRLCEAGALEGGLSIALDVRPDEAIGAICAGIGGSAARLRVTDVRDRPRPEVRVRLGELEEGWEVGDVPALVHNLNDLFRDDRRAKGVAVLGEWEDALQLWCVAKDVLPTIMRERWFEARNRDQLEALA